MVSSGGAEKEFLALATQSGKAQSENCHSGAEKVTGSLNHAKIPHKIKALLSETTGHDNINTEGFSHIIKHI